MRPETALRRIQAACDTARDGQDLFERLSAEMHDLVPHDGAIWFGADPATLLVTSPIRVEALEASCCDVFWHNEFHVPDTAQFVDLARNATPVAALNLSLDGRVVRSPRYRDLLAPQGYADELRGVLRNGEDTWGLVGLYREAGRAPFSAEDVALVAHVSPVIARALRHHVRDRCRWIDASGAPGLVVFDDASHVVSANPEALDWLRNVLPEHETEPRPDEPVIDAIEAMLTADRVERQASPLWALLNRARALGAGLDDRAARLRMRDRGGRWLVLNGSRLAGRDDESPGTVAIVIEPAKSSEIAPIIVAAYSLTPREREVVGALARGDATSEIAANLFLSQHTVRDHIKTVLEKLEVSSRTELVAKLFAEHYSEPAHADLVHAG